MARSSANIKIEGLDKLFKELKNLPDKLKRKELLKILRTSARPTLNTAKANLKRIMSQTKGRYPAWYKTSGNLVKSLGLITGKNMENPTILVGARVKGGNKGFHAHFLELGTVKRKKKGKGFKRKKETYTGSNLGYVKPQPFLRPAYDAHKQMAAKELEQSIAKYLQKQINRKFK